MGFEAAEAAEYVPVLYQTFWALVPPLVAILLALITKEVYSSLFAGVIVGGLIYSYSYTSPYVNPVMSLNHIFKDGLIKQLSDEGHVGILIFLVFLGIIVAMMNKAGGSAAFGEWASSAFTQEDPQCLLRHFSDALSLSMTISTVLPSVR